MTDALANRTLVALSPQEVSAAQAHLADWCMQKMRALGTEYRELAENLRLAKHAKWHNKGVRTALLRTKRLIQYYQKIRAAVRAGYLIVPNFDSGCAPRCSRCAPAMRFGTIHGAASLIQIAVVVIALLALEDQVIGSVLNRQQEILSTIHIASRIERPMPLLESVDVFDVPEQPQSLLPIQHLLVLDFRHIERTASEVLLRAYEERPVIAATDVTSVWRIWWQWKEPREYMRINDTRWRVAHVADLDAEVDVSNPVRGSGGWSNDQSWLGMRQIDICTLNRLVCRKGVRERVTYDGENSFLPDADLIQAYRDEGENKVSEDQQPIKYQRPTARRAASLAIGFVVWCLFGPLRYWRGINSHRHVLSDAAATAIAIIVLSIGVLLWLLLDVPSTWGWWL